MLVSLIRSIILYVLLIAAIRLMGKRQIGQLEPSEFVVALLIADLAAVPMQDLGIPLLAGVIPILTVLAIEVLLSVISYHSLSIRRLLCGSPIVLIEHGRILDKNLKQTRITTDELMEQLRQNGLFDLSAVQLAVLETNGQISAFSASSEQENPDALPLTLIINGKILKENLSLSGFSESNLTQILQKENLTPDQVFLFTTTTKGRFYLSKKQEEA